MRSSLVTAFFMFVSLASYAYAFYMGTIWLYKDFENHLYDRDYTSGDILTCFLGIITGF